MADIQIKDGSENVYPVVGNENVIGSLTLASGVKFVGTTTGDYQNQLAKCWNVVTLLFCFEASGFTASSWSTIATLPIGFYPSETIPCIVSVLGSGHSAGQTYDGRITSSGAVQIYTWNMTAITTRAMIQVSYIV